MSVVGGLGMRVVVVGMSAEANDPEQRDRDEERHDDDHGACTFEPDGYECSTDERRDAGSGEQFA